MTVFTAVEDPVGRPAVRWVFDVVATLAAAAAGLPDLVRADRASDATVIVLIVVCAPLVLRRLWPVPVFAGVLAAALVVAAWDVSAVPGPPLLVALYTVAALQPRRTALVAVGVLEVALSVTLVRVMGVEGWWVALLLTGPVAAAVALGLYTATRRAYLAELRERARRLELERDREVALAAATERSRIAREMHDIVAHHLTVMVALSDGAVAALRSSPDQAAEVMQTVSATGRRALADTRRLLGVLRDPSPDPADPATGAAGERAPLPDLAELDQLVERVRAAGLPTSLQVTGSERYVPADVQLTVYRLVQEALTNTLKHGGPGVRAAVRLAYEPDALRVEVDDDGAGATAPAATGAGGGLVGMRERVHALGGEVWSGPGRGGGWRVAASLALVTGTPDQRGAA